MGPLSHVFSLDILLNICRFLPLVHLRVLSRSQFWKNHIYNLLNDRFITLLILWHLNPGLLLPLMRVHNIIISGSAALHLVVPGRWFPQDLDFYCPKDNVDNLLNHLRLHDYVIKKQYLSIYDLSDGLLAIHELRHTRFHNKINVMESVSSSPHLPLFFFHSTLVMNYISADGVVSFYPAATFQHIGLVNRTHASYRVHTLKAIIKYIERGFKVYPDCDTFHENHNHKFECLCTWRLSNDKHPLSMTFYPHHPLRLYPAIEWQLGGSHHGSAGVPTKPYIRVMGEGDYTRHSGPISS